MCSEAGDTTAVAACNNEEYVTASCHANTNANIQDRSETRIKKINATSIETKCEADVGKMHHNDLNNQCAYTNSNSELSVMIEHLDTNSVMGDSGILSASDGTPELNVNYQNGSSDETDIKSSEFSNDSTLPNGSVRHQLHCSLPANQQQFVPTMEPADSAQYNITVLDSSAVANSHLPYMPNAGLHYTSSSHSPNHISPSTHSLGSNSRGQNSPPNSQNQHAVLVHINPGETFSVRVGDQIQHIQGQHILYNYYYYIFVIRVYSHNTHVK